MSGDLHCTLVQVEPRSKCLVPARAYGKTLARVIVIAAIELVAQVTRKTQYKLPRKIETGIQETTVLAVGAHKYLLTAQIGFGEWCRY